MIISDDERSAYEEIRALLHRYMFSLDDCTDSNSGYDLADLFTEDGRFGTGNNLGIAGRDALARIVTQADGNLPL